jgi:tripartite-type tricarboxylate transporter receptor subunit TctC
MKPIKGFFLVTVEVITVSLVLLFFYLGICSGQQQTKEKFPNRPITLINNYGAGGAQDVAIRILAKVAERKLGVPIIVVNKTGGGGTVGITELARSKPDGYTIGFLTIGAVVVVPMMQKVAFDPFKDFAYICGFGRFTYGLFTKGDSPFKSFKDVVEAARKDPGKITYGTLSPSLAIASKYVEAKENIKMTYIPVQSGQEAAAAALGGHFNFVITAPDLLFQYVESKEVRLLAVAAGERWFFVPDVPTLKELGYDIDLTGWMGLGAPAGTPKDSLDVIYEAFRVASNDPETKANLERNWLYAPYITGEELKQIFQKRVIEWKPLIEEIMATQKK